jgi:hypothetical protein
VLPAAWTYWQPLDASVRGAAVAPELPLPQADIAIEGAAGARWSHLSEAARQAVLAHGFAIVERSAKGARFGESYAALRDAGLPYVVTLDTLFWLAHVVRDRALAAAEESVLAPALDTLLARLALRLGAEAAASPADLEAGYALARGLVAVAQSLLSPAYHPPVDLARVVAAEQAKIAAHTGPSESPLLGVTLDYSLIVPRGAADASGARAAYARATAWLGTAPFGFAARDEFPGAELSTSGARAHTRAALLLARLVEFDVDAQAAYAFHRWTQLGVFFGGGTDDVAARGLLETAKSVGIDVRDARAFADVVKIDRARHALLAKRAPRLDDGAAIAGVPVPASAPDEKREFLRAATTFRLLADRGELDAEVLQSLVFPSVGKLDPRKSDSPPPTARGTVRAFPRALDVAAWLGDADARRFLSDSSDDAFDGYGATFEALVARRPSEAKAHDSVYASSIDAIATYLAPSAADRGQPGASSPAWRHHRLESALASWATLRHDALAFARFPLTSTTSAPPTPPKAPAPASAPPAFVEVHPEAIAQLLSLVRQTALGIQARGHVPTTSAALPILASAESLLADAFAVARREADDEELTADERSALLTFPARLAALEAGLVPSHAAEASLAVDVHTDDVSGAALVEAAGDLDDLYVVVRTPHTGRLVLAVGATASHYEVTEPAALRATDATWRARLHGTPAPQRAEFTKEYLAPRPGEDGEDGDPGDSPHASR